MTDFIDRTEEQIKQDIEKNYNVIDWALWNGRRDDRDALEAAKAVLQKYIAEDLLWYEWNLVLWTKNNAWRSWEILDNIPDEVKKSQWWVIHEYEVLINELNQNIRDLEWTNHYLWTSVAPHIQRLAWRINSAESKVLINRRLYQAKRDIYDTFWLNVTYKEPNYFWSQEVNGIPMDEILKNSIVQGAKWGIFFLDYSACIDDAWDPQIKKDILEKTWNYLISLRFDEATNKFEYYDMDGNALDIHPVAWKWIVLWKKWVIDSTHYIHESPIFSWVVNWKTLDEVMEDRGDKIGNLSYTLDYSDCPNAEIKSQVVALMWDPVVDLNYDKDWLGFYFVNKSWERVHWDIKMWEWVRVASHEYNNYLQLQRENEQLSSAREQFDTESHSRYFALRSEIMGSDGMLSFDKLKWIEKYKNILDQLDNLAPKWSKWLEDSEAVDLIISIESRLDEVVYKNKRYGFDLDVWEAVSRDGSWYYQANFVWWSDIIREVLFKVDWMTNQWQTMLLPRKEFSKLYELKDFMSARLRDKRNSWAFDQYELAESFIVQWKRIDTNDENEINKLELRNYGLSQLLKWCDDFKKEYEEWWDSQPPELQALMREIRKYYRTLNNDFWNKKSWTDSEWMSVKDNLFSLFLKFKNNDWNYASMTDTTAKEYFDAIFSWSDKADIDLAVKSLCNWLTFLDNTTAQIDPDSYKEDLRIKDTNYEYYWKNITKKLSIDINSNDSDEWDEFVFDPEENKVIIDNLLWEIRWLSSVNHEEKLVKFIKYLQSPLEFLPKNVNFEDNEEVKKSAESILSALENKISFLDSKKRELSPKQYRESLKNREKELQWKELNDEELVELNWINAMLELSDKELKEYYLDDINKSAEISLKYWGMSTIFDGQLTQYLVKKWGGVYWTSEKSQAVASQINDSFWLRWWWDWSDETCKAAAPFLQDLLIEVAITATAIALWAVTAWAWTAAIATLRATAFAAKAAKVASLASKVSKFGKVERIARVIWSWSRKIIRISNRIKDTKYVKTTLWLAQRAKTTVAWTVERTASTRVWRMLYRNTEWIRQTSFWSKWESIWKMIARWNALRQTTTWYKFAWFLIEWTWFHVSSTALHNAINWQNIMDWLNPFWTTEIVDPETWEKITVPNARWYAESIAFLWVLKAVWAPIQNLTQNTLWTLLETPLTEGILKNAITNCVSVWWEMVSLGVTEQFLNQAFEWEWKKMTTEDFIRSLGMVIWLRWTRLMGKWKKWLIKEYDKAKQELTLDIWEWTVRVNAGWNIIESTIDIWKPWDNLYFEWKESRLWLKETQARENSSFMDDILENINEWNQREQLDKLKNEIIKQYEKATWKNIELTDEQVLSIMKTHLQEGELWNLKRKELSKKVKTLAETIKDPEIRRFLMEAWFCWEQALYPEHIESSYKDFLEKNSSIKEGVERWDFWFLWKKVEDLYKDLLTKTLETIEWKSIAEQESLIFDFNTRFQSSLEFVSGKFDKIKFLYEGKLIEGTITKYWESLLWKDFESSPTKKLFFDKLKSSMFYQHLDNPLKFCSHGADHSILVDKYVQNIIEKNPDVVRSVENKYWVDETWAIQLLRLTAVFHDFWYPDIWKLAKSMHWPFWWVHFINEYASPENSTFVEYIKQNLWVKDQAINQLINDMRDAVFFHSADKVEKGYLNRITYKKWSFLLWNDFTAKGTDEFIDILTRESDWSMTITYRSEEWRRNAEEFVKKLLEKYPKLDKEKIRIEKDENSYDYDLEFDYEYESDGKTIKRDENWEPIRKYEYHWRKWKTWDSWIEFQPIDLITDPLAWIVRLADNMDMSFDRLTPIQRHPIFMNLLYNLWYEHNNPRSASHIFKEIEKFKNGKSTEEDVRKLIDDANKNWWIEITVFDETTWKPKERFAVQFDPKDLFNPDWNVDLYTYKSFIIKEMAKNQKYLNDPNIDIIQNIAKDDDISSYSFRHFVGLTPIRDVTIEDWNLIVKVDKNIYLDPNLWSQKLSEKWWFDERPVVEYHIRRLFDASWRVTVGSIPGERTWLLNLTIIDWTTEEIIWTASRNTAQETFNIKYNVNTPDIDEQF